MRLLDNKDRAGSLLILAFSSAYLRYALVLPLDPTASVESFTPRTLPVGLAIGAILLAFVQLFLSVRQGEENSVSASVRGFNWRPAILLTLAMTVYAMAFDVLGFLPASYLFLLSGFFILGERRIVLSAMVAAALVLFLWVTLTQLFGLYLHPGDLFRYVARVPS